MNLMQSLTLSPRIRQIETKYRAPIAKLLYDLHWNKSLMHREIADRLEVPRPTITRWFHFWGVPSQDSHRITNLNLLNIGPRKTIPARPKVVKPRPWKVNNEFFDKWSHEMAYVLGFICADGSIFVNPRGSHYLSISITDWDLLVELKSLLGSGHKLSEKRRKETRWKPAWVVQIGSKKIFNRLVDIGVTPKKAERVRVPSMPRKYLADFIRGYFDGDGGVWYGFSHKNDRGNPTKVLSAGFTSCSEGMLTDIALTLLRMARMRLKKPTFCSGAFRLQYSTVDSRKLYYFLYHPREELYLKRKKVIFEKYLGT